MTTWSDLGLAVSEDDEWDPTLATVESAGAEVEESDDPWEAAPRPLLLPDGSVDLERGFVDSRDVLRVWIDADGVIIKARFAPLWRERVMKGRTGSEAQWLAAAVGQVFASINATRPRLAQPDPFDTSDVEPGEVPLSWEALGNIRSQLAEAQEALDALGEDAGHGHWEGERAVGAGADGHVRIELNEQGRYAGIDFDNAWLKTSRVGQLCRALPEAARAAHAQRGPATWVPGERDRITARATDLRRQLAAMMKRGFH